MRDAAKGSSPTPSYPMPDSEDRRLRSLESFHILATGPEEGFDVIVRHARRLFGAPIAAISFVAADHQFFKARQGVNFCVSSREGSFCTHAILERDIFVVPDATLDERFRSSPFVTGPLQIRFYAGAPLVSPEGQVIGSLCIMDTTPRHGFGEADREALRDLAEMVLERLEARRAALAEESGKRRFDAVAQASVDAIICADGDNRILTWNGAAERMFGYSAAEAVGRSLSIIVPPAQRAMHEAGVKGAVSGRPTRLIGSLVTVSAVRKDGSEFPIELSLSHWQEAGAHRFGAIIRDITDRITAEAGLKRAADFDSLTGLSNRRVLEQRMAAAADGGRAAAVILVDLDGFKEINDSLGHAAGDEVLKTVAARLDHLSQGVALASRLGGDEFVILVEGNADPMAATALAHSAIAEIVRPIEIGLRCVYVGASCGVAVSEGGEWQADRLLADADLALYRAKADGKRPVRLFTQELRPLEHARESLSSGVRQAWERREFELYYQPQVRLRDGAIVGAEALIRWNHPERGVLSPAAFLSTLEEGLLAVPVSEWILRTACIQASEWRALGASTFRMGVNLFAAQFRSGDLPAVVAAALRDAGLPAGGLELEITENTILKNESRITSILHELRAIGVGIAFDDYGTGYASLTMLKDFPVSRLKIDRSFVSGSGLGRSNVAIVEAITRLASGFDLDVIAEGIETPEQADFMRHHCAEGQGYLFGRPMPAEDFSRLLLARQSRHAVA
ncbi:diguanylate phosphodiesterase [Aureimonas sp. Leaf460]|nr:diguanylate phosphodiesterase [Aureimonas sp. Leaf427]KQT80549.1 diguanylate phosphodiesterase [Aureimonas sp. Leaf460]